MMIGERPVALAEKAMRLDPQSRKQLWCDQRSSAVAAVQHHPHVARNFSNPFGNVLDVAVDNLFAAQTSLATREFSSHRQIVKVLDVGSVNRFLAQSELESVVFRRVVRAGDLNAANDVEVVLGPIRERSGDDYEVDDVDSAGEESC